MEFNPVHNNVSLPTLFEYSIRKPCPTCQANPLQLCNAPLKAKSFGPRDIGRLHSTRQKLGRRHWEQDKIRACAPEIEDRILPTLHTLKD